MKNFKLPELLCPAGSIEALHAAIDGGADAVYMGGTSFNARINAKNFNISDIKESASLAHKYNAKLYETLNIQIYDKEIKELLNAAYSSLEVGVDAFIVSDMGAAALIKKFIPEAEIHASTQLSIHNLDGAKVAEKLGFTRIVPARELSYENIKVLTDKSPLEVEIFVHGALCVSHSGQCLFSSLVGGRSGNRGLCAQPCRLNYSCGGKNDIYPLSLKDMSLAMHIDKILELGVHSLKIEGRMKSPEYVNTVAKVWRRLLDEKRNANSDDMTLLDSAFSRGGFTDGYFVSDISKKMLGVRSEENKQKTRELEPFSKIQRKIGLCMNVKVKNNEPLELYISCGDYNIKVTGDIPMTAINSPISNETLKNQLSRLGNTDYFLEKLECEIDDGLMYPISKLNALRREGIERLEEITAQKEQKSITKIPSDLKYEISRNRREQKNTARFISKEQITTTAREYFDEIYLPLTDYDKTADGFIMPSVVFDSEKEHIIKLINNAIECGAKVAILSNVGQIEMLKNFDIKVIADYRFNIMNSRHIYELEKLDVNESILSPELTLPKIRDICGNTGVIVYGRVPLMTLEKCVIRDNFGCNECKKHKGNDMLELCDRRGYKFPIMREFDHRNIIYNSIPFSMSDKENDLLAANIVNRHFIFSVEKPKDVDFVISAYKEHKICFENGKRIKDK